MGLPRGVVTDSPAWGASFWGDSASQALCLTLLWALASWVVTRPSGQATQSVLPLSHGPAQLLPPLPPQPQGSAESILTLAHRAASRGLALASLQGQDPSAACRPLCGASPGEVPQMG